MSKRILIIHPYRHVGGPDTFVLNIIRALGRQGDFQFLVASPVQRDFVGEAENLGARTIVIPEIRTFPRTISPVGWTCYFKAVQQSLKMLEQAVEENIDVVHAVNETMWPFLIYRRWKKCHKVISIHGMRFLFPYWAGFINAQLMALYADTIICVSKALQKELINRYIPAQKLSVVPSSVDLDQFRPDIGGNQFREELNISRDSLLIGAIGSIDERKGSLYFVEACGEVAKHIPSAHFLLMGDIGSSISWQMKDYVQRIRQRIVALNLEGNFHLMPARKNIPQVMAALDVLVQPSLTEAAPRAPLEAMAMKCPVVATRVGGTVEEIEENISGILVEPRNSFELAQAMISLMNNPDLRMEMGKAGRKRIEQYYSLESTAMMMQKIYQER